MDPDGFSSSLDLMKPVIAFWIGGEPSGDPSGDAEETLSSEGQKMHKPPLHVLQAYDWE